MDPRIFVFVLLGLAPSYVGICAAQNSSTLSPTVTTSNIMAISAFSIAPSGTIDSASSSAATETTSETTTGIISSAAGSAGTPAGTTTGVLAGGASADITSSLPAITSTTSSVITATSGGSATISSSPDTTSDVTATTSDVTAITSSSPAITSSNPAITSSSPVTTSGILSSVTTGASSSELTTTETESTSAVNFSAASVTTNNVTADITAADNVTSRGSTSFVAAVSSIGETTTTTVETTTTTPTTTTTTLAPSSSVCGVEVEGINASSPCHPSKHRTVQLESMKCDRDQLKPGEWLRLTTKNAPCGRITQFAPGTCYQPGLFGATYVWYTTGTSLPANFSQATAKFCTTDIGATKAAYCCVMALDIDLMNCGNKYYVYKLSKSMPASACGKVGVFSTADAPKFSHTINNGKNLPPKFEELTLEEKEQVVALELIIVNLREFEKQWEKATTDLKKKVIVEVKKWFSARRKKRGADSSEVNVDVLAGYPQVSEDKKTAFYLLSVHRGDGEPIDKRIVTKALKHLEGTDPSDTSSGSEIGKTTDLPVHLQQQLPPKPVLQEAPPSSKLWKGIIIIIGVTAFIVALAFIAVWCYSFSRRGRSGNMQVSTAKRGLVGDDELNNVYKPTEGHVNAALDVEDGGSAVDNNQNANGKNTKDSSSIEMQQVEENTV